MAPQTPNRRGRAWIHRAAFLRDYPYEVSAVTDNQFILDLMPQHPIYVDLLPHAARKVVGQCHKDGEGARRLLEWEGFAFSNVVDIFDGGPLMSARRDHIRTLRESRRMRVEVISDTSAGGRALDLRAGEPPSRGQLPYAQHAGTRPTGR